MMNWFKKETKLDKLKKRYKYLMRKSYEIALKDKEKSDYIHDKAEAVFEQIKSLRYQYAEK
ncbi:Lacal_2735 family protein [Marixanthomonas ophiurae]|uniref:Lacal_2735 family protein n=1 Tax=Marixanthomonas ophiurae TaxID=387659 RepID=A0A3E1QCT7_9FLAO|nr:Lacal_2735 family protein [Marixanthomonas ophiurae]RFN59969.1 Lacal_2735 family protein [Marixanthomonas ophiurae]